MDYGVYFQITNGLGVPLYFSRFVSAEGNCCTYDGPQWIPNDSKPHQVHLNDPCGGRGAEGTAYFIAEVGDELREYAWYGDCPVWSSTNNATGPGVTAYNRGGHPLTVTVAVDRSTPGWTLADQPIHHIFVLMLENRSFDHMLGFSGITGTDAVTGDATSVAGLTGSESNTYNGTRYPVTRGADRSMPLDPLHEFQDVLLQLAGPGAGYPPGGPYPAINNSGFVDSYAGAGGQSNPGEIMKCFTPAELPVLNALAENFAVCDAWHSSMPGPTWPNRFFAMAASAGGLDRSPSTSQILTWESVAGFTFEHGSLFDALNGNRKNWRIYRGDIGPTVGSIPIASGLKNIQVARDVWNFSNFASDLQGDYPAAFTWIEPNYGAAADDTYLGGTSQHPIDNVTDGETLIKQTYEAIRNSPLWQSSMLIVTWDEHGGFYDHVQPRSAVKPGDRITTPGPVNLYGFAFDTLGIRVPAVIVSPYIPRNIIDHRPYDHSSIPATVERLFGFGALTARDAAANDVLSLVTLGSPRDTPTRLPNPAILPPAAFDEVPERVDVTAEPIGHSNLAGFLQTALHCHLQMTPAQEHPAIRAEVGSFTTRAQALAYIDDIAAKLNDTLAGKQAATPIDGLAAAQMGLRSFSETNEVLDLVTEEYTGYAIDV
jgi:phospholipase C